MMKSGVVFHPINLVLLGLTLCLISLLTSCTAETYANRAEASGQSVLKEFTDSTLGDRRQTVQYPKKAETQKEPKEVEPEVPKETIVIDLNKALEMALAGNRTYISRKESLFLSALSLVDTRHTFSPQLSATLSYLLNDAIGSPRSQDTQLSMSISQKLSHGGTVTVSGNTDYNSNPASITDPRTFSSSLGVTLSQPLLQGAGRDIALESLIQAERNVVYAVRDFEIYRQEFSIDVAQRYYNLVGQKKQLDNSRKSLDTVVNTRKKADRMLDALKGTKLQALQALRNELEARNNLFFDEARFQLELDRFKVFLGIPITSKISIKEAQVKFTPIEYDIDSAVDVALANRLDFLTRKEQLEDSERALAIAKDGLLPNLDLNLGYNISGDPDPTYGNQSLDNGSYNVGLSLGIPLDRVSQQNSYRRAQISNLQSIRSFDEFRDNLIISIKSSFRDLERTQKSLANRQRLIDIEKANVRIAGIQLDRGDINNRDLLEAQESLLQAENTLVDEEISYEVARLNLLKDLGILFIDEKGMWEQ